MHSQPPKSPLSAGRGTLEPSRRSELLVDVYLFLSFTIVSLILHPDPVSSQALSIPPCYSVTVELFGHIPPFSSFVFHVVIKSKNKT